MPIDTTELRNTTCGELSCEDCNAQREAAADEIDALRAELAAAKRIEAFDRPRTYHGRGVMDYQQKLEALNAIGHATVHMRNLSNWYCSISGAEIKRGSILSSPTSASLTPEAAIEAAWEAYTNLPPDQYIVLNAMKETRCGYRWNGYRWAEVKEPTR